MTDTSFALSVSFKTRVSFVKFSVVIVCISKQNNNKPILKDFLPLRSSKGEKNLWNGGWEERKDLTLQKEYDIFSNILYIYVVI